MRAGRGTLTEGEGGVRGHQQVGPVCRTQQGARGWCVVTLITQGHLYS